MKCVILCSLLLFNLFACSTPAKRMKTNRPMIPVAVAIPEATPQATPNFPTPLSPIPPTLPLLSIKSPSSIYAPFSQVKLLEFSEAFSMTHEIPRLKLSALKYLNLQLEFDVVAIQTSAVDTWLAMDTLLAWHPKKAAVDRAQELIFPPFWQSHEMKGLLRFVASHPSEPSLYLSGYLSDLGYASGYRNQLIMPLLSAKLKAYGLQGPLEEITRKLNPLSGLQNCASSGYPKNAAEELAVKAALQTLGEFISKTAPEVLRRNPASPHSGMLKILPISFQNNLASCLQHRKDPKKMEAQNADLILKIVSTLSKTGHVFNWNAQRSPAGRVDILKQNLGKDYAILGAFAINGAALLEGVPPKPFDIPLFQSELQNQFEGRLDVVSYLETRNKPYFLSESLVWTEGTRVLMQLGRDYDGLFFIPRVSPAHLLLPFGK